MSRIRRVLALVVVAATSTAVAACGVVGGGGTYDVVAYFPRAVALYESGAVQVLGLPAGEVKSIEVVDDQVRVTMAIDDDVPIPVGVKAALVPQSLIGERRIQLFPPYKDGDDLIADGHEIAAEDTIIPVEPDETLAAIKEFLDSLDPDAVGRLIDNGATALEGQGENLGSALEELSELVDNVEASDDQIITIAERFDEFTATLLTRESQLARAIDDFSVVAGVLADERASVETLITSLASLSENGLDLVSEHALRLRTDVDIVARLVRAAATNVDAVGDLIVSNPAIADGFAGAYNEELRAFDLRNNFAPLAAEALDPVFDSAGLVVPCVPILVACPDGVVPLSGDDAVSARLSRPTSPVDAILAFLSAPATAEVTRTEAAEPSVWRRLIGTVLGVGA